MSLCADVILTELSKLNKSELLDLIVYRKISSQVTNKALVSLLVRKCVPLVDENGNTKSEVVHANGNGIGNMKVMATETQTTEALKNMKLENGTAPTPSPTPTTPTPSTPTSIGDGPSFEDQFKAFSKFGDTKSDGSHITLSQSDKWMKQAKVIDGKTITTTDTGIHFKKLKSLKVTLADYKKFLEELAKAKKVEVDTLKSKMANCGAPGRSSSASGGKTPSAVDRLTDTSKYTGTHKQRFDESGKGKGIAGRKDVVDKSGYVTGSQIPKKN